MPMMCGAKISMGPKMKARTPLSPVLMRRYLLAIMVVLLLRGLMFLIVADMPESSQLWLR